MTRRRPPTPGQIAVLRAMHEGADTYHAIGRRLDRSDAAVVHTMHRLLHAQLVEQTHVPSLFRAGERARYRLTEAGRALVRGAA